MAQLRRFAYWFKIFCWSTVVALGVRMFVVETFRIESDSMLPNLHDGDIVFTSKYNYNIFLPFTELVLFSPASPTVSSIVVHQLPDKPERTFIKRVVAVAGDTIQMMDGRLFLNNAPALYKKIENSQWTWEQVGNNSPYLVTVDQGADFGPIEVPAGYFYVLGDNRGESIDSRVWGPLPHSCLRAKLSFVWDRSPRPHPAPPMALGVHKAQSESGLKVNIP